MTLITAATLIAVRMLTRSLETLLCVLRSMFLCCVISSCIVPSFLVT
jgi:hypothetical protein